MPNSLLSIDVFDENKQPLDQVDISIYFNQQLVDHQISKVNQSTIFILTTKPKENSLDPFFPEPYFSYDITIKKEGFKLEERKDIRVFEGISSFLEILMEKEYA